MGLVPAGLLASLPDDLFPHTVTLQQGRTYANVSGLVDLEARVVPVGGSKRMAWALSQGASHVIYLRGHYPTASVKMRAVSNGTNYNVIAVEHPAETMTTLAVATTAPTG